MPTGRHSLAVGVVDYVLYALGGVNVFVPGHVVNTVEAYDPSTNSWTIKASIPIGMSY